MVERLRSVESGRGGGWVWVGGGVAGGGAAPKLGWVVSGRVESRAEVNAGWRAVRVSRAV